MHISISSNDSVAEKSDSSKNEEEKSHGKQQINECSKFKLDESKFKLENNEVHNTKGESKWSKKPVEEKQDEWCKTRGETCIGNL